MSGDPLYVQPDGVRSYSQIHDEVVAGLTQLMGTGAGEAVGVETTHGPIALPVSGALSQVLASRGGTLQTTSRSGSTISGLLQKAAQMYEQGDQKGAATLRAAAEALEGVNAPGGPGVTGTPGSPGSGGGSGSGGADMAGQMLGQVGQQAGQLGQMAQSVAQPLQGLAQGLQQLPQQVVQGVQQAVQQASQSAEKAVDAKDTGQTDLTAPQQDSRDQAAPGESANTGRAPEPPQTQRAHPAQTRPQAE
jgi:hypothetical protein